MSRSRASTSTDKPAAAPRGVLLDTHVFLWLAARDELVPKRTRARIEAPDVAVWLSVASVWELAIKRSLGKLETDIPLAQLLDSQCEAMAVEILPIQRGHALAVEALPFHHRDPFDRLIVAQAIVEGLAVASTDESFDSYPVQRIW